MPANRRPSVRMKSVRTFLSILASAAIVAVTALVPTATMAVPPTGPAGAAYAGINVEVEAGTVLGLMSAPFR